MKGLAQTAVALLEARPSTLILTSLMIVLEIGSARCFCRATRNRGTWKAHLDGHEAGPAQDHDFYKVGHHGSHNATPKKFVEKLLGDDFWAMVSTTHVDNWPRIPRVELLEALGKRTQKVARSDQLDQLPSGFTAHEELYVETTIPGLSPSRGHSADRGTGRARPGSLDRRPWSRVSSVARVPRARATRPACSGAARSRS